MDKDFRFIPADSVVYSRWVHRSFWTLEEASWVLSGYERHDFRRGGVPLEADIEASTAVNRYEMALLEGVEQSHGLGCRYDAADRLIIERKEEIEGRVGFSPDWGDSLALTFTEEIFEPLQKLEEPAWMRQLLRHARAGSRPWMRRGCA